MRAVLTWVYRNADDFFAIVLAACFVTLGYLDIAGTATVNNAILLILGARTAADLRDRARRRGSEQELRAEIAASTRQMQQGLDAISSVRVLTGSQVGTEHAEARRDTSRWVFKGGTGTYVRAVTLPKCVENARLARRSLSFRMQIIDPTDEAVCRAYARFRQSVAHLPDATGEPWTVDRTRKESYASILSACWYQEHYKLLDIDVRLSSTRTTMRWDLSSSRLILTQDDPFGTALVFDNGRPYYDYWDIELRESLDQSPSVPLERAGDLYLGDEPTVDTVRTLFDRLGMKLPRSFTDRDVSDIVRKALRPKNPYER
jgi:hypothetical protein